MARHTFAYSFLVNITLLTSSIYLLWLSKSYDVTLSQHRECVALSTYQLFLRYKFKPAPVTVSSGRNNFPTLPEEFKFNESLFEAGVQHTCWDVLSYSSRSPRGGHTHTTLPSCTRPPTHCCGSCRILVTDSSTLRPCSASRVMSDVKLILNAQLSAK